MSRKFYHQKLRDYYSIYELSYVLGVDIQSLKKLFGVHKRITVYGVSDFFVEREEVKKHFPLVIYGLSPMYVPQDNLCQNMIEQMAIATFKFNDYAKLKLIPSKQIRYFYDMKKDIIKYFLIKGFCQYARLQERKTVDGKKEIFIAFDFNIYGEYFGFHQKYNTEMKNFIKLYPDTLSDANFDANRLHMYIHHTINKEDFIGEEIKKLILNKF